MKNLDFNAFMVESTSDYKNGQYLVETCINIQVFNVSSDVSISWHPQIIKSMFKMRKMSEFVEELENKFLSVQDPWAQLSFSVSSANTDEVYKEYDHSNENDTRKFEIEFNNNLINISKNHFFVSICLVYFSL